MIAVDTNVLVRLLVNDDAAQAERARRLFEQQAEQDGSIWVSDVVLVELTWVLLRAYERSRAEVSRALEALCRHATVKLQSAEAIRQALRLYAQNQADFADCLLAVQAPAAGCDVVFTFDRKMQRLAGVRALP